ncbi:MAG: CpsD/CapB family tyrosine-protein kinase [Pirellulales bacterium]|nr:CpsD/CapB family tyrosine-protein kinase [Pirellulales bacterium]
MIVETETKQTQEQFAKTSYYESDVSLYCRELLRAIPWPQSGMASPDRALGITSVSRGEGASTIAAHLAATAASCNEDPVLLIDFDLTCPAVHRLFGVPSVPGLACLLDERHQGRCLVQRSPYTNLSILSAGEVNGSPAKVYHAATLPMLLREIVSNFALTIFDMPPVEQSSYLTPLSGLIDGVVLVVEARRVKRQAALTAIDLLNRMDLPILGTVFNKRRQRLPDWLRAGS